MSNTTIHHVIGIDGATLIVFYTEAHCWQFRLISAGGTVFGERKIYGERRSCAQGGAGVDCSGKLEFILNGLLN